MEKIGCIISYNDNDHKYIELTDEQYNAFVKLCNEQSDSYIEFEIRKEPLTDEAINLLKRFDISIVKFDVQKYIKYYENIEDVDISYIFF